MKNARIDIAKPPPGVPDDVALEPPDSVGGFARLPKGTVLEKGDMVWGQHCELPIGTWQRMSDRDRASFKLAARRHPWGLSRLPPGYAGRRTDSLTVSWTAFYRRKRR